MPLNNRIEDLHPSLAAVYTEAKAAYHAAEPAAPRVELNETHRSMAVMQAYYAQGRQPLAEINRLRALAGLYLLGAAEAKTPVTWVLPGNSKHAKTPAEAFDVRLIDRVTGKATWEPAAFVLFAKYVKAAAAKLGKRISQGAYWKKKDYPHTELA